MDNIPKRTKITVYRQYLEPLEKYLWLPIKNPDIYSLVGVVFSLSFFFIHNTLLLIVFIVIILFVDWLDGATARRYNLSSREGYIIDTVADRVSEACMFLPIFFSLLGSIFFFFYLVNLFLSCYALQFGKHYVLPLRFLYLLILVWQIRL